ncbi:immobilization antigen (macronuclear) [Tetrahymena thermophila SB210]|uniref:Immobilization antigen n=1 Tax=Tetrahymena thermophila (strain SB210) TaxID=312017 RepID=Q23UC0_TETTS|nr:immobilization antigen [Tetrahymena thermophila SB210]EAS00145.1 immobilization antigen [Tetrahymena thermophila SB210]|eukprot:XP_001020390.1 immobilization antigen [Tetrahymena thermophila SB210]
MRKLIIIVLVLVSYVQSQICPSYASWVAGSTNACQCNNGYYGTSPSTCKACPDNSWSTQGSTNTGPSITVSACNQCAPGYFVSTVAVTTPGSEAAAKCTTCGTTHSTPNTMATTQQTISDCNTCMDGYYLTVVAVTGGSAAAATCQACASQGAITRLRATDTPQTANDCNLCLPGYWVSSAFAQGGPAIRCTACPPGLTNSASATGATGLQTIASCDTCPIGFYVTAIAQSGGPVSCAPCPPNSSSPPSKNLGFCTCFDTNAPALSSSVTSCACKTNYFGSVATAPLAASGCVLCNDPNANYSLINGKCACRANTYGTPTSNATTPPTSSTCYNCPTDATSPAGTTEKAGCNNSKILLPLVTLLFSLILLL